MRKSAIIYFAVAAFVILSSCKSKQSKVPVETDTPTTGEITISADQSLAPVVNAEAENFQSIYHEAKIKVNFKSEPDAINDLINNRVRLIVISRKLNGEEQSHLRQDYPPKQFIMGMDAAVLFVNKMNSDTNLYYEWVKDILSGKISEWKQINAHSSLGNITLIFDNNRSSLYNYLKNELLNGEPVSPNAFAVDSNAAVISYVEKDPAGIGVISASWISTLGDTSAERILKSVKLVGISKPDSSTNTQFYRPVHKEMMLRKYPLMRGIYIISREEYPGLGTGFATYVLSDDGQTIVERAGLVPAKQPLRVIELKNEF